MKNYAFCFALLSVALFSNKLNAQVDHFQGGWVKINTTYLFEFDLILRHDSDNKVEGYFNWKLVSYDEYSDWSINYYQDKMGATAKEYVSGTYDPSTGQYRLKGYKKEDPEQVVGIDTYRLQVDENGFINGKTNSGGTWLGRIKGRRIQAAEL